MSSVVCQLVVHREVIDNRHTLTADLLLPRNPALMFATLLVKCGGGEGGDMNVFLFLYRLNMAVLRLVQGRTTKFLASTALNRLPLGSKRAFLPLQPPTSLSSAPPHALQPAMLPV